MNMKRILSLLLVLLCTTASLMAQNKHKIYIKTTPEGVADAYRLIKAVPLKCYAFSEEFELEAEEGTEYKFYLSTPSSIKYDFKCVLMDGKEIVMEKYNSSFSFVMPDHDVTLTACFEFNPNSPKDPESSLIFHNLSLNVMPAHAGRTNFTKTKLKEGERVKVRVDTDNKYKFVAWTDQNCDTVSLSYEFFYTMPDHDVQLTAHYQFSPNNPTEQMTNGWDEAKGELYLDYFDSQYPVNEVYAIMRNFGHTEDDIKVFILSGYVNGRISVGSLKNVEVLDLSRVHGTPILDIYPHYAENYLYPGVRSIKLPACTTKIEEKCLGGLTGLEEMTVYALNPPTLAKNCLQQMAPGAVLYVPGQSVEAYQASPWAEYFAAVLPITDDIVKVNVNLPESYSDGRLRNMTIELANKKSGQLFRTLITDQTQYTFVNMIKRTEYTGYIRNPQGDILAKVDDIKLEDKDVEVNFTDIQTIRNVRMNVFAGDDDVTDHTTITWYDVNGNYISQGSTLKSQVPKNLLTGVATQVRYSIQLDKELAASYLQPSDGVYTLIDSNNAPSVKLETIPLVALRGTVSDARTGGLIKGVVVMATQTVGGKFEMTHRAETDLQGSFVLEGLLDAPVSISLTGGVNYMDGTFELDDVKQAAALTLQPARGPQLFVTVKSHSTDLTGAPAGSWRAGHLGDMLISLHNVTTDEPITAFSVQNEAITLANELPDGTELQITLQSKDGSFADASSIVKIEAGKDAKLDVDVVQNGAVEMRYLTTENTGVVAILFDAEGRQFAQQTYVDAEATFTALPKGKYTAVTLGESRMLNDIHSLADMEKVGLMAEYDFLADFISVEPGRVCTIVCDSVPSLDVSKLYYTNSDTYFNINKTDASTGQYLTLGSKIAFKDDYADARNVVLSIDLPEDVTFIDGSVVLGGKTTSAYTIEGKRVNVQLGSKLDDKVKFCIMPSRGGEYMASASITFQLDGKSYFQPLGSVRFKASDLALNMAEVTSKPTFMANGSTISGSSVRVFDGDVQIGQASADGTGFWNVQCTLQDPYNLSTHNIHAEVVTPGGIRLTSESHLLTYDISSVQLAKASILYWNPEMQKHYTSTYDFINPNNRPEDYIYYINNREFTFTAEFTDNDTTKVQDVFICVKTGLGRYETLPAQFDGRRQRWVAQGYFGNGFDGDIPVSLSVKFTNVQPPVVDTKLMEDVIENPAKVQEEEFAKIDALMNELLDKIDAEMGLDEPDMDRLAQLEMQYKQLIGVTSDDEVTMTKEEREALVKRIRENQITSMVYGIESLGSVEDIEQYYPGYSKTTCEGLTPESLLAAGYERFAGTAGQDYYYLVAHEEFTVVDLANNVKVTYPVGDIEELLYGTKARSKTQNFWPFTRDFESEMEEVCIALYDYVDTLKGYMSNLADLCNPTLEFIEESIKDLNNVRNGYLNEYELEMARKMRGMKYDPNILKMCKEGSKEYGSMLTKFKKARDLVKNLKVGKFAEKGFSIFGFIQDIINVSQDISGLVKLYKSVPNPCEKNQAGADAIRDDIADFGYWAAAYHTFKIGSDIFAIKAAFASVVAAPSTGGASLAGVLLAIGKLAANYATDKLYSNRRDALFERSKKAINNLKCKKKKEPEYPDKGPFPPEGQPDGNPGLDPSGYVYEGVHSNRVPGVTASIFYKEVTEDIYGDKHEEAVLWDASKYAQENPLFTDEQGMYRWDVPSGLWQVRFQKEGYQAAQTEWLPVPPPQLDVNVAIRQDKQPEVLRSTAYEDRVEVQFDKYMQPSTLTADNIRLSLIKGADEQQVSKLDIDYLNLEGEGDEQYVSHIAIKPADSQLTQFDKARLTIANKVESYAGQNMQDTYQQLLPISQRISALVVDSIYAIESDAKSTITVTALPATAVQGRKLMVRSGSDEIVSVATPEVQFDAEGKAVISLDGGMAGITGLNLRVSDGSLLDQTLVQASTLVRVSDGASFALHPADPVASRPSGTYVSRGQTIALSSNTEGAVIYYTLDGSCPCNPDTRILYREPIVIDRNVTITAMAVSPSLMESNIVEFTYKLRDDATAIKQVTHVSQTGVYDIQGRKIPDDAKTARGTYIRDGKKVQKR